MKIKKGMHLIVKHDRSGTWKGIATDDFDTEKDTVCISGAVYDKIFESLPTNKQDNE